MPPPGKEKYPRASRLALLLLLSAGCARPLPEEGTHGAELYRARCGSCHFPTQPSSLKYATWEMVLPRMETRMRAAGQLPLADEERTEIRSYLERNAG